MSHDEHSKKNAPDEIDAFIERNEYKIKLHVRAVLAERKISLRDILTMKEKQFEQVIEWLAEKNVPVKEEKSFYNFRHADDSPLYKKSPSVPFIPPELIAVETEQDMVAEEGSRQLVPPKVMGDLKVIDVDSTHTNVHVIVKNRQIIIPYDLFSKRKISYGISFAKYLDTMTPVSTEDRAEIRSNIIKQFPNYSDINTKPSEPHKEESKMKIGDLPSGDRKLTQGRLGTLGGLPVTSADRFRTNVILNDREIEIPRDMAYSKEGIMGHVYSVNYAEYVDDGKRVPKEIAEDLQKRIAASYAENGSYVKFE